MRRFEHRCVGKYGEDGKILQLPLRNFLLRLKANILFRKGRIFGILESEDPWSEVERFLPRVSGIAPRTARQNEALNFNQSFRKDQRMSPIMGW